MVRFLHAADIHLDSQLRGLENYDGAPVEKIRQATREALVGLVDLAISRRVDFVLIAGDLYDGDWKDYNTGLFFVAQLVRLRQEGIRTFIIRGNHDAANRMTQSLHLPNNADGTTALFGHQSASTVQLDDIRVAIHGQSFESQAEYRNLVDEFPPAVPGYFNIGLLHTSLTGAEGHEPYAPCTVEQLQRKGYDYWALGHVHERMVIEGDDRHPWVVFPGNPQGRHIREPGAKGCYIVEIADGRCSAEFVPVDVFRWLLCEVIISDSSDELDPTDQVAAERRIVDEIRQQLDATLCKAEDRPCAIRVELSGATRFHDDLHARYEHWCHQIRSLTLEVGSGQIWLEKVRLSTKPIDLKSASHDGPLAEIDEVAQAMLTDDDLAKEFLAELASLRRKLPDEIQSGNTGLALNSKSTIQEHLEDAVPLLTHLLRRPEGEDASRAI